MDVAIKRTEALDGRGRVVPLVSLLYFSHDPPWKSVDGTISAWKKNYAHLGMRKLQRLCGRGKHSPSDSWRNGSPPHSR